MGAQIAAHLVNADVPTILFDLPAREGEPALSPSSLPLPSPQSSPASGRGGEGGRQSSIPAGERGAVSLREPSLNGIVNKALEGLKKLDPSPLASPSRLNFIAAANYDQHLDQLRDCDLVIEAIAERMDWKADLYRKVAPHLGAQTIFASNTSGLSINKLAQVFPENLRHRFCGIHFFNPPRYMHLVELIPCIETDALLLNQLETFLVSGLGKGVVRAKDTPNFLANRIGVFSLLATLHHAQRLGLGFDTVDALTGRYLGRPKSATFRTLDVVGLDTFAHVVNTMRDNLHDDPWHAYYAVPDWLNSLIEQGALGQKAKRGVYQKMGKDIHVLDLGSKQYRPSHGEVDDGVKAILRERDWGKKLHDLRGSAHPQAQFVWSVFRDLFHYCGVHLADIAGNARDLDFAVRWGFGWDSGPFEIWQSAGWQKIVGWIEEERERGKTMSDAALPHWARDAARVAVHTALGSYSPDGTTSHSTKPASGQVAGYRPLAGEGLGEREGGSYQQRSQLTVYQRQEFPDR
ncbi:MAG: 3-hydroxyacyl-CoA dehydrogenase family protein, partial [Gallionella sp.]